MLPLPTAAQTTVPCSKQIKIEALLILFPLNHDFLEILVFLFFFLKKNCIPNKMSLSHIFPLVKSLFLLHHIFSFPKLAGSLL